MPVYLGLEIEGKREREREREREGNRKGDGQIGRHDRIRGEMQPFESQ